MIVAGRWVRHRLTNGFGGAVYPSWRGAAGLGITCAKDRGPCKNLGSHVDERAIIDSKPLPE